MKVEIGITKIDEVGIGIKPDKDHDHMVATISVKAGVHPSDIARLVHLINQKVALYCHIGSQQAQLDLAMVEITGERVDPFKPAAPAAEEKPATAKEIADEHLVEQLETEADWKFTQEKQQDQAALDKIKTEAPSICQDCVTLPTCDRSYFHPGANESDPLTCDRKQTPETPAQQWSTIEKTTDQLRADEEKANANGNGKEPAKKRRSRKAKMF